MKEPRFAGVIVAAGNSTRMGTGRSKVQEDLGGKPVLAWSLETLAACPEIGEVAVVCREEDRPALEPLAAGLPVPVAFVPGGADRQTSVRRGVEAVSPRWEYLLFHDGARPLVTPETVARVCEDAVRYGAATAALPVKDTVKVGAEGFVVSTPDRSTLFAVQTPQAFRRELYREALDKAGEAAFTDDCQLLEAQGIPVRLTPGDPRALKLTTPEDLTALRAFLEERREAGMRIGSGYDVHRLVEGRKLILGGVEIPFEKGLLGHSDADVLTHAVADAFLGAAALGDIGHLFPDTDPQWEGADSLKLLEEVLRVVRRAGYEPVNLDVTLMAQRPKIAPHVPKMRENLAAVCGLPVSAVSVKATTEEGLGFTGAEEGMSASAVCLIRAR